MGHPYVRKVWIIGTDVQHLTMHSMSPRVTFIQYFYCYDYLPQCLQECISILVVLPLLFKLNALLGGLIKFILMFRVESMKTCK
jgi:hypothetical protein